MTLWLEGLSHWTAGATCWRKFAEERPERRQNLEAMVKAADPRLFGHLWAKEDEVESLLKTFAAHHLYAQQRLFRINDS